ncbi:helix-turn-helix domain-containing protein [Nostoc sp.]|uniref:helix-turn-helix domain-containing protein n=1 Tax=Nostoc sp. TaxID=1180 RepID=UPI002FFB310E
MKYHLDIDRLSRLTRQKRGTNRLREVANEAGISPSTLSRVERGQTPDLSSFVALCNWLDISPSTFFGSDEISNSLSIPEAIALQLQADKNLDPHTAKVLAILVKAAYRDLEK